MILQVIAAARAEVNDAIACYESKRPGLGVEFADDLDHTYEEIVAAPERWAPVRGNIRRRLLSRFQYGVIYELRGNTVIVFAVAHSRRKPDYWGKRAP